MSILYTFATLNGWTAIRTNGLATAGLPVAQDTSSLQSSFFDPGATLPGVEQAQFNMVAHDTPADRAEIKFCPSTGDSGAGAEFYAHTGSPAASGVRSETCQMGHGGAVGGSSFDLGFSGAHTGYHIYTDTNPDGSRYLHGWVEGTTNTFWHFAMGTFVKSGTYGGGQYCAATYIDGFESFHTPFQWPSFAGANTAAFVRMDSAFGSGIPGWRKMFGWAFDQGSDDSFLGGAFYGGQNSFNLRTPLGPIIQPYWNSDSPSSTSSAWKFMGHTQDLRLVSMDGLEPKQTIVLGADTWDIIPAFRKGIETAASAYVKTGTDQDQTTNQMGYAYRRTV